VTAGSGRPRVLLLTPDFPPATGGIQLLLHRFATLASRVRVSVVTRRDHADAADWDARSGLHVRRSPAVPGSRRAGLVALNALALVEARRLRPDAILCGHVVGAPAAVIARRLGGAPIVAYLYADEAPAQPQLARLVLRRASTTIAVSRYTRDLALGLGAPAAGVAVVPPGVDLPAARGTRGLRATQPTIVTVARLTDRYKGHDVMLAALPAIRARVPGARWVVVGDGPLRGELEARAHALGLDGAVDFAGALPDAERDAWLDRAHVFAMPSRLPPSGAGGEGFGIVYLEAGAHGLPVLAGAVAGAPDAVVDGETGVLVAPDDVGAVADAVAGLLLDRDRAAKLGAAGARRAAQLSWPRMVAAVEDVLLEAIAR